MSDIVELLPCPFCGRAPDEDDHYLNQGTKCGGILCCIEGPEVRAGYDAWPAWKERAIIAWNTRVSPWRPIEAAPKDGTQILAYGPYEEMGVVAWSGRQEWRYQADGSDAIESQGDTWTFYKIMGVPTHWMPLPEPPSEGT